MRNALEVECRTAEEVNVAIAAGNVPVLIGDFAVVLSTDCKVICKEGSPRLECYGTCSPRMESHGASSPTMVSHDTSSPRMESHGASSPTMESYGTSSPRMVSYDASFPRMESYGTSSPVRVVMCVRCAMGKGSPGSDG